MPSLIIGTLVSKKVFGEWGLGEFMGESGLIRIAGAALTALDPHQAYELTGERVKHPKYGDRFEVQTAVPYLAPHRGAIADYLSRNFSGIGDKTAERIIAHYEETDSLQGLRTLLVERPWELSSLDLGPGVRKVVFKEGEGGAAAGYLYRILAARHLGVGVPDSVLRRLSAWLLSQFDGKESAAARAITWFQQDPFNPIAHVRGYGFRYADAVARSLSIQADSPVRIAALLYDVLRRAVDAECHTFLPQHDFEERVLAIDPNIHFELGASYLSQRRYPVVRDERNNFYLEDMQRIEDDVAEMLYPMLQEGKPLRPFADEKSLELDIAAIEARLDSKAPLDIAQRAAVSGLLRSGKRLHTLTAPPGCGKTQLLEIFCQMTLQAVAFCTPTGKAAKVLLPRVQRYGWKATTIHHLLEPSTDGFQRNSEHQLDFDVVVVDEASMVDLALFWALLLALKPTAHLILVGDPDQVGSVAPGNVLANIRKMEADHHALSKPYRNGGDILKMISAVRNGKFELPPIGSADVTYVDRLDTTEECFAQVEDEYLSAIGRAGISQTVLLLAMRKGNREQPGWNTTYMNARLQARINPGGEPVRGTGFRIGDRVIILKNMLLPPPANSNISLAVVNGDTGYVASMILKPDSQVELYYIVLDDGRRIGMPLDLSDHVGLAYALTVHKSQGSEYQEVIVVVASGGASFMNRPLFYTAISRARTHLSLFGDAPVLARVVRRSGGVRYSALVHKVSNPRLP